MAASIYSSPVHGERDLRGQTVVVIGGSSGIGLETAMVPPDVARPPWWCQESPLRFDGCLAPGRHPGAALGVRDSAGPAADVRSAHTGGGW